MYNDLSPNADVRRLLLFIQYGKYCYLSSLLKPWISFSAYFLLAYHIFPPDEENEKTQSWVIYYNSWSASLSSSKSGDARLPGVQWLMGCLWPTIERPTIKACFISKLCIWKINADSKPPRPSNPPLMFNHALHAFVSACVLRMTDVHLNIFFLAGKR